MMQTSRGGTASEIDRRMDGDRNSKNASISYQYGREVGGRFDEGMIDGGKNGP